MLHSDWLVLKMQSSLEAELTLLSFCFLSLNGSTGAIWLHFLLKHCHRNVTPPCCSVWMHLVSTTLPGTLSLQNCKNPNMQHLLGAELIRVSLPLMWIWVCVVLGCLWLSAGDVRSLTKFSWITKQISPWRPHHCWIWYLWCSLSTL